MMTSPIDRNKTKKFKRYLFCTYFNNSLLFSNCFFFIFDSWNEL